MAYCEMCGREIPDGQRRCAHCAPEARQSSAGWTFSDQRNDLLYILPRVSGKVGYVIEFEG